MNKKQKEIINKFYKAYLKGEKSLKSIIQEKIKELEENDNWKRELNYECVIFEGYISKSKYFHCCDGKITVDDEEIYIIFLNNLFNSKFNINGKVYPKIKNSVINTLEQYFGKFKVKNKEKIYIRRDNYSDNETNNVIGISKFKNTGIDLCLEKAMLVQNLLSIIDIKTYFVTTNVTYINDPNDKYEAHAFNIIKFCGKTRMFDCSLGLYDVYDKNGNFVKVDIYDEELYHNDLHRIATGSVINIDGISYGMGCRNNWFLRILQTRIFDTEYDNEYLNKVIGGKRALKREKEVFSTTTTMAHLILPQIFTNNLKEYIKLKEMIDKNDGSLEEYINKKYLIFMKGCSKKSSNKFEFYVKTKIEDVEYKGKKTKMVILKLPMADRRIYKFESKFAGIVLDDKFPRFFILNYGYPHKKIESKDCTLYEVINGMSIVVDVLKDEKIDTFCDSIKKEINKKDTILERKFEEELFEEFFDMKFDSRTYKLALDIYNKDLMKADLETSSLKIKFKTKISCKKCNLYLGIIDEFPTAYVKDDYLGYFDICALNFMCEFVKSELVCPFRFLCFIESLIKNTNIPEKYVLEKLIKLQEKREKDNEEI